MTHPIDLAPSPPPAHAEMLAATWLTRRQGGLDAHEESRFQAWLAESDANRHAFDALTATAAHVRGLPADALAELARRLQRDLAAQDAADRVAAASAARPSAATPCGRGAGRPSWLRPGLRWLPRAAAAAAVSAVVGASWLGWSHWQAQPTFSQTYATQRGQQLDVSLPDGSSLQLDTATRLQVTLYRQRREVRLWEGQVMFTVASAAAPQGTGKDRTTAMPFVVQAGALNVRVVGTKFSVRHTASGLEPGGVGVAVQEGRVRVSPMAAPTAAAQDGSLRAVELTAGQRVSADGDGRLGEIGRIPPGAAAAWREHRVSFENTPLAQALAEFERYGATGMSITDPRVAALRLGGSFDLRRLDRFAAVLPQMLPVRLVHQNGQTEIVSAR